MWKEPLRGTIRELAGEYCDGVDGYSGQLRDTMARKDRSTGRRRLGGASNVLVGFARCLTSVSQQRLLSGRLPA